MLAPIDKLEAGGNDILQIDVTTICDEACSNCTRLLPYRRDYRHMSLDCFEEALRCSADWPGVIALFGGNPCAHPEFPALCEILERYVPDQRRRGLWSNNLLKHGEAARRTFFPGGRLNLNAHANPKAVESFARWMPGKVIPSSRRRPSWHGPVLIDRRDYDVSDAEWTEAREACDINQHWSGAIVERDGEPYGYFCEIASSLDGVRGENHGVRLYPGWWREGMRAFGEQVRQCCDRGCGVPLRLKGHLDQDEVYDVSPSWAALQARKPTAMVVNRELGGERSRELTDYQRLRSRG